MHKTTTPPLTKAQRTRLKILRVAFKHLSAFGYRGALIRDICKEAGYSTGALYNHFKDKEDLFKNAFRYGGEALEKDMVSATKKAPKKQLKIFAELTVKHRAFLRLFDVDALLKTTEETDVFLTSLKGSLKSIAPKLNLNRILHRLQLAAALLRSPAHHVEQWPQLLFFSPEPKRCAV